MGHLHYKGYIGSVEYSEEDNSLYGETLGMKRNAITYEGTSISELEADFQEGVDCYLEYCETSGIEPEKAFGDSLSVVIPADIHRKVVLLAERKGVSVDVFVRESLAKRVTAEL
ncbi:hypothetical protein Barb4_01336 [Bacteroidales bacterium Barb4]|nr:hypothetical protein Barb4_01336 [Bacteroidales bacterium Barb4]